MMYMSADPWARGHVGASAQPGGRLTNYFVTNLAPTRE